MPTRHDFIESLLDRMSLAQKVGQMTQPERMAITPAQVTEYHIGSVLSGGGSWPGCNQPADWVAMNDAYWVAAMACDPAIPILYGVDAIHGHNNVLGATVFPHNIGLGAAHNPDLIEQIARATAREVLATGVEWTFAPTLAVAQDPHWGRMYESYSADPALVTEYAGRFVIGMQDGLGEDAVIACAKHWVGDGGTTDGIDQGETTLDFASLRATHIRPYLAALDAGVLTVMVSFNSWNGSKCHGDHDLVTGYLKEELGFEGFVISDWDGIDQLSDDYPEAIALSVNAGVDMFMVSEQWPDFIAGLTRQVEAGVVSMDRVDDAVRRILGVKYDYGLFERPRPRDRKWSGSDTFGSAAHRDVAREAVQQSLVLLKNDNHLLPLSSDVRILVAGRLADDPGAQCGGFTVTWQGQTGQDSVPGATSIWQGIRALAPNAVLAETGTSDAHCDVAIVVIGETPYAEGLGDIREDDNVLIAAGSAIRGSFKALDPYGRSLTLADLHPEDLETITSLSAQGIPVVTVMVSGRPLITDREMNVSSAFVAAWLPGSEGGGVADVLFGVQPFIGRLPFPWPSACGEKFPIGFRQEALVPE